MFYRGPGGGGVCSEAAHDFPNFLNFLSKYERTSDGFAYENDIWKFQRNKIESEKREKEKREERKEKNRLGASCRAASASGIVYWMLEKRSFPNSHLPCLDSQLPHVLQAYINFDYRHHKISRPLNIYIYIYIRGGRLSGV